MGCLRPNATIRAGHAGVPLALCALAYAFAGCVPAPARRLTANAVSEAPAPLGRASSSFIFDPENPALSLPSNVRFHPPEPVGSLVLPHYPSSALAARESAVVGLRFVVDAEGTVGSLSPSPLVESSSGRHAREFRAAAESAVRQWRFTPGWIVWTEDGEPDFTRPVHAAYRSAYLDVRFDFAIVRTGGEVRWSGAGSL